MPLRLQFDTDNDAFYTYRPAEIARILREVARQVEKVWPMQIEVGQSAGYPITDINGNQIGKWEYTES